MQIKKLTDLIIAQIAAGEVIESPTAVIKELLENSIDAGAHKIEIILHELGMTSIQIRDDGCGMDKDDLPLALESFATSKISSSDDLFHIVSMGFRGEALSSIRSISKVTIESRGPNSKTAWRITGEGESISQPETCALPSGTRILVENLFFNVPIRKKFLQSDKKIKQEIIELLYSYSIAYPHITIICAMGREQIVHAPAAESLFEKLSHIYSDKFMKSMTPVYYELNEFKIQGYLSVSGFYHSRPVFIKFFVNNRPVIYPVVNKLLKKAYGELLPPGKFPAAFLFTEVSPEAIDVNVHPQKKEIRFKDEALANDVIFNSISRGIESRGSVNVTHKLQYSSRKTASVSNTAALYEPLLEFKTPIQVNEQRQLIKETEQPDRMIESASRILQPEIIHSRLFNTFILASSRDGVFLIDQHTAHERIQYETYLEKLKKNELSAQTLLSPAAVELSPAEKITLLENHKQISELGFEIEDFGPAGIKILSVPAYLMKGEEAEGIRVLLNIISGDAEINQEMMFDSMVKSLACRTAIKKGEQASLSDYREIIEKLYSCRQPLRCPHGRPTVIHLSRNDIHGLFNRPLV